MRNKKKVAIIGTNGIPARYGGFETLAQHITEELFSKYDFTVYCSNIYSKEERRKQFNNSRLLYLPLRANGFQSILYDIISTLHAWITSDILLVLGPSAGFILPLNIIFRKKIVVNHGGLDEWKRKKFTFFQRQLSYLNHLIAGKVAASNIADNYPLMISLKKEFNITSEIIEYGGDHVNKKRITDDTKRKYKFTQNSYDLSISRAQVDNNLHMLLQAYEKIPERVLVIISNWAVSDYGINLKNKYLDKFENIKILDAIYDINELDILRSNASLYIHSHSQCGTAPSLVEAMNYKIPIICFDVDTNRATTEGKSEYFSNEKELIVLVKNIKPTRLLELGNEMFDTAKKKYRWSIIGKKYDELFK